MEIRIYQICPQRDKENVLFYGFDELRTLKATDSIDPDIYDMVFSGNVDCDNLEDVFKTFNQEHPDVYKGNSLSVSDIIEVVETTEKVGKGFYFCDNCGFTEIEAYQNEADKTVWIKKQSN